MAKNKIEIDYEVKDRKGSTKKMALESKNAAKGLDDVGKNARTADRNLKGAAQTSSSGTKNFSKMAQGVGGLVGVYATLAAQVFAVTAAFQFLQRVGDLRVLQDSQVAYASTTGVAIGNLSKQIRNAADDFLTFEQASKAAAIGVASGLTQESLIKLGKGAAAVSKILGRDVADSFDRLVRGVTKAEPELLDELGITLRLEDAKNKFAISLGKTASQLSLLEQKQAVNVEVQTQLEEKFIQTTEAIDTQGNAVKKFGVAFNNVFVKFANLISGPVEAVARFFTENIYALIAAISLFAVGILKTMLPSLDAFTLKAEESASRAAAAYDEARVSYEALKKATGQEGLRTSLKEVKAKPGSGIANLQGGKDVTKRQAAALLRYAKLEKGVYNDLTRYQKTVYKKALKDILGQKETFVERSKRLFLGLGNSINRVTKKVGVVWRKTMASMSAAMSGLGKALDKVYRKMVLVQIVIMAMAGVLKGLRFLGIVDEVPQSLKDLQTEIDNNRESLQALNREFAKLTDVVSGRVGAAGGPSIAVLKTISNAVVTAGKELLKFKQLAKESRKLKEGLGGNMVTNFLTGTPGLDIGKSGKSKEQLRNILNRSLQASGLKQNIGDSEEELTNTIETFELLGQTVTTLEESFDTSNRTFDKFAANIKTFQTSVSDQLSTTKKEIDLFTAKIGTLGQVLVDNETEEVKKMKAQLIDRLGYLFLINDAETKIQKQKFEGEIKHNLLIQRATKLVKARLNDEKKLSDLENERLKLLSQIALKEVDGVKISEEKVSVLNAQEASLKTQIDLLKEQMEFLFKLGQVAAQAFEDGFSSGLEALISGESSSLSKTVLKMVDTIKKAMAKQIADSITEQIMSTALFSKMGLKTKAQRDKEVAKRIQTAMVDAGLEVATLIEDGMKRATDYFNEKVLKPDEPELLKSKDPLETSGVGAKITAEDITKTKNVNLSIQEKLNNMPDGTFDNPIHVILGNEKLRPGAENIVPKKGTGSKIIRTTPALPDGDGLGDNTESQKENTDGLGDNTQALSEFGNTIANMSLALVSGGGSGMGRQLAMTAANAGINAFFEGLVARNGGVFSQGKKVQGYASGGIARGSTSGYPAMLHGTEAVVPLPKGGKIPVEMKGAGTQNNITVNVSTDGQTGKQGSTGPDMDKLGGAVAQAVQVELQNQKRSGGILNPYGVA